MTEFDFDATIRWARFDPRRTLARRRDEDLPFVEKSFRGGQGLLLDTCVYIDQLQDRSPAVLDELIDRRQVNHSIIVIQELMHSVGALDPRDGRTPRIVAEIRKHILSMPGHRIFTPDAGTLGKAALLSGMLCRLQSYAHDRKLRALLDCTLFLQAQELGLVLLTANVSDFDILLQLLPKGRVLFYRRK